MTRATPSIACTRVSNGPFRRRRGDVRTTETLAPCSGDDVGGAGREIQHRRNAAHRLQREKRHRDARGIGQQHADGIAFGRQHRLEFSAEHLCADDQLLVRELAAERIFDRGLAGVARLPRRTRASNNVWSIGVVSTAKSVIMSCSAAPAARRRCLPGARIDLELHGRQNGHRCFREPAFFVCDSAEIAEMRALQPVDANRMTGASALSAIIAVPS